MVRENEVQVQPSSNAKKTLSGAELMEKFFLPKSIWSVWMNYFPF